jgi:hypothetical protein
MAILAQDARDTLKPFLDKHGGDEKTRDDVAAAERHVDGIRASLYAGRRPKDMLGDFSRLMDLQSARTLVGAVEGLLSSLEPTAMALRDQEGFPAAVRHATRQTKRQIDWLRAQCQTRAPQTLIVPANRSSGKMIF